jgi:hypothetical protein
VSGGVGQEHQRGDYRLRRAGLLWAVERRWPGGWTRVGQPMRHVTAHAVFHELDDWQRHAGSEALSIMRGEVPRANRGGP